MTEIPLLRAKASSESTTFWLVPIELILAIISGIGLTALGAGGAAWILGGIGSGALAFYGYRSRFNPAAKPNRTARKLGQILIGLTVGFAIQHSNLAHLSSQLPIFGLLTVGLLISAGAIGYLYARLEPTDLLTAILATTPGNIGVMASIAADYGKNASLVSLVQLLRFTVITLLMPLLIHTATNTAPLGSLSTALENLIGTVWSLPYLQWLCLVLLATAIAVYWGSKFKIPVATFICPIAVGLLFNQAIAATPLPSYPEFTLPPILNVLGQILLGITIGESWGMNPKLNRATVARAIVPVALIVTVGVVSAGAMMLLTPWDWLTCLLVAAPGGSPEMIWLALALHHDVEVVTAGHLIRLIAVNLSLPVVVSLARYLENAFALSADSDQGEKSLSPNLR